MSRLQFVLLALSAAACASPPPAQAPEPQLQSSARPRADAIITTYPGRGVTRLPDSVIARFKLDAAFYKKFASAGGIPVISSALVPDEALLVTRDIMIHMLSKRPDLKADLIQRGGR